MKTIIWDVDDVLNDLMKSWFENLWLRKHPQLRVTYESLTENPPHHILKIGLEAYQRSLDQFRLSEAFTSMEPNTQILQWFKAHGHKCRHIALTATPLETAHVSASWVTKHFGRWIRTFAFVPSERPNQSLPVYEKTKYDYVKWIGQGDVIIDDNPDNLTAFSNIGMVLLGIRRPWNPHGLLISDALKRLTQLIGS
ncbi:MAG: hypothetical protein DRH15_07640 [Deltaproteobacteria bacterium]|nr:MAG: hypothetical protein DRH15_07640 [Deltaproteobacteria bacterium]